MSRARRFPLLLLAVVATFVAFAPAPARALHATAQADPDVRWATGADLSFGLGASLGVVEGSATELAFSYPFGRKFKLSELTWDLKDVALAGVHGSVGIGRRFRLNLGVWSALSEGNGMMIDRDWAYADSFSVFLEPDSRNWTHESRHPDTTVDKVIVLDQNLSVMALQFGSFSLSGIVGYKHDTWKWSARGGTYIYSTEEFRDTIGSFPAGERVITYEQKYSIPYVGVGASWDFPAFQLETHLLFSPLVSASDSDLHVLRGVLFEGDFSGGTYVGLGLNAVWLFAEHWSAALGVEYQSIPEITGDVKITGAEGNEFFGGGGGLSLSAASVTLGAGYRF